MEKARGRRPYKKCLGLVIKIYEGLIEDDNVDTMVEELAALKKRLNTEEVEVINKLCKSMNQTTVIEIDEASPGSDLNLKA